MPQTNLSKILPDRLIFRDRDLVKDVMGEMSFTEAFFLLLTGRRASPGEARIVDTVLVTLMEAGFAPQAIATRMIYLSSPDSIQGAMAAGLLGIGGQFAGTMEGAAALLEEIVAVGDSGEAAAHAIVARFRSLKKAIPGFGHRHHKPDDPRSQRLFDVARESGVGGKYVAAMKLLSREVDQAFGKHITINATGAIAAVLLEINIPASIMRGIAVISRSAGLLAHIREEQVSPSALHLVDVVDEAMNYSETPLVADAAGRKR